MPKRRSKSRGQLLSIVDRLPGGLPMVTCTPPRSPRGEGKHRCDRALASGEAFLEWQPGSGDERRIAGCAFHLGATDPDFTVEDYQFIWTHANYGLVAGYEDRVLYLVEVPIQRRAYLRQVLSRCYLAMLRRRQDAREREVGCSSRNWEAFRQQYLEKQP